LVEKASIKPKVFTRDATGLIRSIGPWSGLIYAIANTGYLYSLFFDASLFPSFSTATDLVYAALISLIPIFCYTTVYYYFTAMAPRTGGDYVWVSRWLHPLVGFVSTAIGICFLEFLFVGLTGLTIETTGFSIMFSTIGSILHNSYLVSIAPSMNSQPAILLLGSIVIWGLGALVILGTRFYFKAQLVFYVIVFAIMALLLGIFVTTNPTTFATNFNVYAAANGANTTNYYGQVVSSAQTAGWSLPSPSWANVALLIPFFLPVVAFNTLSYVGGEFKSSRKNWAIGLYGGAFSLITWLSIAILGSYHAFGYQFMSAISYLIYNKPTALVLPSIPYVNYLAAIAVPGIPIAVVLLSLAVLQQMYYQPAATFTTSRALFAFAFDRVIPERFARVSSRFNSPIYAVVLVLALSEVMLIFFALPFSATYAFLFNNEASLLGLMFPGILLGITAIIFPFRHRATYESSPIRASLAGVPRLTLVGIITTAFFIFGVYMFLTNALYGANGPYALGVTITVIVGSIAIYLISYFIRRHQGVPVQLVFSEIPPE
jgi:amino acid transporter